MTEIKATLTSLLSFYAKFSLFHKFYTFSHFEKLEKENEFSREKTVLEKLSSKCEELNKKLRSVVTGHSNEIFLLTPGSENFTPFRRWKNEIFDF